MNAAQVRKRRTRNAFAHVQIERVNALQVLEDGIRHSFATESVELSNAAQVRKCRGRQEGVR